MKDQVLSVEQMQRLMELGVDVSKASMCYVFFESDGSKYADIVVHDESCYEMACMNPMPTFTLQDMIELMPYGIDYVFSLVISKDYIAYRNDDSNVSKHLTYSDYSMLENAYDMIVWLAKNKYI